MFKVERLVVKYKPSETVTKQGKASLEGTYRKRGFYVQKSECGYYVFVKPARVHVNAHCEGGKTFRIYAKQEILDYYGGENISYEMAMRFQNDFDAGKLTVMADESGIIISAAEA